VHPAHHLQYKSDYVRKAGSRDKISRGDNSCESLLIVGDLRAGPWGGDHRPESAAEHEATSAQSRRVAIGRWTAGMLRRPSAAD